MPVAMRVCKLPFFFGRVGADVASEVTTIPDDGGVKAVEDVGAVMPGCKPSKYALCRKDVDLLPDGKRTDRR
jgi:hypothetical protein